jgi:hypothetical protein
MNGLEWPVGKAIAFGAALTVLGALVALAVEALAAAYERWQDGRNSW